MTKQKEFFHSMFLSRTMDDGSNKISIQHCIYKTSNNKLEFVLNDEQLEELSLDTQLRLNVVKLYEAYYIIYSTYNNDE